MEGGATWLERKNAAAADVRKNDKSFLKVLLL